MPALVAGIHVFFDSEMQDVDGRDKPGHDETLYAASLALLSSKPASIKA